MPVTNVLDKTFEDITDLSVPTASFINLLPVQLDEDGITYMLNIFRTYTINEEVRRNVQYYITYEADEEEWWENIAFNVYDTVELWWVNCMMNDVINPFEELSPGQNLNIMKTDMVPTIVREIRNRADEHIL